MTNRPKDIGTKAETAVVKFLRANGWPHAERRALTGSLDQGDVTGCPGLVFEVKGGDAARNASDGQIAAWLAETETERINARADIGVLVVQRKGIGPDNAGRWWAVMRLGDVLALCDRRAQDTHRWRTTWPIRMHLADACTLLRWTGYGTPPAPQVTVLSSTDDGVHEALVDAFTNPPAYTAPEDDRG